MSLRRTVPRPLCQARSEVRVRRCARRKTLQERFEVEARASANDGKTPATRDLGENDPGIPGPAPRRIMLAPIGDVDQVIRHFRALFDRGFRGSDVEPTVNGECIRGDDLAVAGARNLMGEPALARGGGPENDQQGRRSDELHGSPRHVTRVAPEDISRRTSDRRSVRKR